MIIREHAVADIATPTGPMRLHVLQPAAPGRYPASCCYSEIYPVSPRRCGGWRRFSPATAIVVAAPEVYHEFEPAGTVLAYDKPGTDRGNDLKFAKEVAAFDGDARAALDWLKSNPGLQRPARRHGHLPRRASRVPRRHEPDVRAAACFYATDIHDHQLGKGNADTAWRGPANQGRAADGVGPAGSAYPARRAAG